MTNGRLKIKTNGKVELKINSKDLSIPKEYDFSSIDHGVYDCEIELVDGRITNIKLNGQDIPKKEAEIQKKAEIHQNREAKQSYQIEYNSILEKQKNSGDSFSLVKAQIPKDTQKLLLNDGDNFALKLFKFARLDYKDNKEREKKFTFFNSKDITRGSGKEKQTIVPSFEIKHNNYGLGSDIEAYSRVSVISGRHLQNSHSLFGERIKAQTFKPNWRVIVGLGTDSVYETGITLHHIYGFPYIPATGIKGITRSYMISEKFHDSENEAFLDKEFCDIFGCVSQSFYKEARKGSITFFDAMPLTPPKLKPDIMNVHYPDYYGEGKAPTDTQNPNPIFFLTVEDTEFQFILGCKDNNLLDTAFTWLKDALSNHGIGAKTAVGYGQLK